VLLDYAKENALPIVGVDYKYSSDSSDERAAAVQLLAQLGNPYSLTVYDDDGASRSITACTAHLKVS
jgi:hypothetical protein